MIVVAICSAGLALSGYPAIIIILFTAVTGAIYISLSLARHGFKITDIVTLLAMILLTAAFMLPAIERTRSRTLGKQFLRSFIPEKYITLFSGSR
jgi:Mn2+/Fe2+ NRAMP family transporter